MLILFFTLGCTEMTREEKNTCYYLTSKSFAYIPHCETESSCYQKIDLLFNKSPNQNQESKLYEIKNDFARSWFFYNKSIKEINNISKSCQSGQASVLPGQINQASFYLEKALKEMEEGIKNSLESIAILEENLTKDKMDLLKEEELFANLIEIREILADLETGNTKNNNYLSYYFNKIEVYNNSEAGKGNWLIEKDSAVMRTYTFYKESFIQSSNEAELPAMSNYLIKSIPALENIFYTYQSLNELKKIPTEKFMRLYSEISGTENSVLKKYAELNPDSGIHYHIDCTDVYDLFTSDFINNHSDYILTELDKWKYKGTYNPRKCVFSSSRNWVRFKDTLKTMEIRIGEMTFDYELLFERIRHSSEIVKTLKDNLLIPVVTKYDKHKANEIVSNRIIKI